MRSPTKTPTKLPDDATLAQRKASARTWFEELRDRICGEFERLEDELSGTHRELAPGRFERKTWQREAGSDGEEVAVPGIVTKLSETPGSIRARAPALGEHTDSVLSALGIGADQIARWRDQGVIG